MQRRRAKQGNGALQLEFRTARQIQPPQAAGEETPICSQAASRAPPPKPSHHHRCGRISRRGDAARPARESATPEEQRNTPRAGSLPHLHGRPREAAPPANRTAADLHLANTAGQEEARRGSTSSTERRRKPWLIGQRCLLRRSPLPPEKQGNDGANPKAWIWPEQTRASPPK
jgi:hypothetical protein